MSPSLIHLDPSDLDRLVVTAAAGDERAWDGLVRRFQPQLLRVARAQGLSLHEAEDAVQDTWMRLMGGIRGVREPRALGGWLTTTARRESQRLRQRNAQELPTADDLASDVSTDDDAEARLDAAACREAVSRALAGLPPRHRRLMRALFDDTAGSYHEIARDLDMPVGSIGPIRGRCLTQLRGNAHLQQLAEAID
ncbi:RNA polymerase sigma factor [Solirubrobacter soli]|uniref:RNA polymerase sigma factor n=1 Tax=Solirubrobacter soli TaxID=363832 RepID=UPI0004021EC0|nr:sigma-70 family RNA polymerase sigma factor [Solirubrobacter soli]